MLVRVLGPLEVCGDAGPIMVAGASQRTVLALLALHAGRPVGRTALTDALWPDGPPPSARNSLQSHVARLRAVLARPGAIVLEPAGYRLAVPRSAVDALHFEDLLRDDATVPDAIALWRGAPLPEFPGEPFRGLAARLTGRYRDGLARCAPAHIERLAEAVREDPCWERGVVALATAFAGDGRRSEALDLLRGHADAVVRELGLDPSAAVRRLQAAMVNDEPRLIPAAAQRPGPETQPAGSPRGPASPVPQRFSSFVGRERECRELAAMVAGPGLTTVTGPGGVGKTRLVAEALRGNIAWVDGADVGEADFVPRLPLRCAPGSGRWTIPSRSSGGRRGSSTWSCWTTVSICWARRSGWWRRCGTFAWW